MNTKLEIKKQEVIDLKKQVANINNISKVLYKIIETPKSIETLQKAKEIIDNHLREQKRLYELGINNQNKLK